jgi:hypothetical protein
MKVTIELVRKHGVNPYYMVSAGIHAEIFMFKDDAPEGDVYNKAKALESAKAYAVVLKTGQLETREVIEIL